MSWKVSLLPKNYKAFISSQNVLKKKRKNKRIMERMKQTSSKTSLRTQTSSGTGIQKLNWKLYSRTHTGSSRRHGFYEWHLKMAKPGLLKISVCGRFQRRDLAQPPFSQIHYKLRNKDISFQQSYYIIIYVWEMYFSIIYKKHLNSAEIIRILKRICDCEPV